MSTVTDSSSPLRIDWGPAPAGSGQRGARPDRVVVRRRSGITSPASWRELAYAIVDLAPSVALFAAIVTLLSAGAGLAVIYVGVPVLMGALVLARWGGALQVLLAEALLRSPVLGPGPLRRRSPGLAALVRAVLADGAAWRAVVYFVVKIALAPVTFAVAVGCYGWGLGAVSYPIWRPYLPAVLADDGTWHHGAQLWNDYFIDTWPRMAVYVAVGLAVLLVAPHVVRRLVAIDRRLIEALLGRR